MAGTFSIYKYCKTNSGWRYCKAAFHSNGKIKPNVVVISGVPQGTGQNRPSGVTSKPANEIAQDFDLFIPLCPDQASPFWFSSSAVHTLGYARGEAGGRAWR